MNKSNIIAKLDTYIREYSKLLDVNSQLKSSLEQEQQEKNFLLEKLEGYKQIVDNSTELVQKAISNSEIIIAQMEKHREDMMKIFNELNDVVELMFNKENFSNEDIENLKKKMNSLEEEINKPIER